MKSRSPVAALASVLAVSQIGTPLSVPQDTASGEDPHASPEALVREVYRLVSFVPGTTPDWPKVRSLFLKDAAVVLRTTRAKNSVFFVQGFVDDFVAFIEKAKAKDTGFSERIVRIKPLVFRGIAHVLVLYEAHIPGSPRSPQQGVDSFQLARTDGRRWIVSIVNDIPAPENPLPRDLEK